MLRCEPCAVRDYTGVCSIVLALGTSHHARSAPPTAAHRAGYCGKEHPERSRFGAILIINCMLGLLLSIQPKSVIRHAESVFDWESEAFGHLARLCPHPASRYAST